MPGNVNYAELLTGFASSKFSALRPAQVAVLDRYAAEHGDSSDVAIELPTGAGKSLVALLIGEAWRRHREHAVAATNASDDTDAGMHATGPDGTDIVPRPLPPHLIDMFRSLYGVELIVQDEQTDSPVNAES